MSLTLGRGISNYSGAGYDDDWFDDLANEEYIPSTIVEPNMLKHSSY
jgi:hypothetical protein